MNYQELLDRLPGESAEEKEKELLNYFNRLSHKEIEDLRYNWPFWARKNQLAPPGNWVHWILLAGRGFGKTRTGAEWVNEQVLSGKSRRIAIVAPTAADTRRTIVEGESGIMAISPPWNRPLYEPSKLQLTWPNGAVASLVSSEEPERLRGPNFDTYWADELAAWSRLEETWSMLMFCLRIGTPRGVITTTPKPVKLLRELLSKEGNGVVVTRGSTYDNVSNLSPVFFSSVIKQYEGTRLGRQELDAEILEDMPGALWNRTAIDNARVPNPGPAMPPILMSSDPVPGSRPEVHDLSVLSSFAKSVMSQVPEDLSRIVVAVDPNASNNEGSDETGIVVAAKGVSGHGYVLADFSMRGSPNEWATTVVLAHDLFRADRIIGEANQGGNMVEHTITTAAKFLKMDGKRSSDFVGIVLVHATRGKVTRAEPVAALYEQGRVSHVGTHSVLEDQMCLFTSDFDRKAMGYSPDRVDALVWALTHLFLEQADTGLLEFYQQEVQKRQKVMEPKPEGDDGKIRMKAPEGVNMAYGQTGSLYNVHAGEVLADPSDIKGLRAAGFVEISL